VSTPRCPLILLDYSRAERPKNLLVEFMPDSARIVDHFSRKRNEASRG